MKTRMVLFGVLGAAALGGMGCEPVVPRELADARAAYARVSNGPAAQAVPADVHKAREQLVIAERAFGDAPDSEEARDFAYVAMRKAELAEARANVVLSAQQKQEAEKEMKQRQAQAANQVQDERSARVSADLRAAEAEQRAKEAQEKLAKVATLKEEPRGTVITLSGNALFTPNRAALTPEARAALDQVADAFSTTKEKTIIIEGQSDSKNMELSQARAEAVRMYLIDRAGYQPESISARGMSKRIQIIVEQPKGK
jgi:outer membrane protein OmpA-like peptidoglycan-associated protein